MKKLKRGKKNIDEMIKKITLFLTLACVVTLVKAVEGRLLITTVPNFFDRWYKSEAETPLSHLPQTQTVYKRQTFHVLPAITGFSAPKGMPNITYNLRITHKGKTVFEKKAVKGLNKKVNDTTTVFLCETVLNYQFENNAAEGEYEIVAEVTDHIKKTTAKISSKLQIISYTYTPQKFTNNDSFYLWQNYYYEGFGMDREIDGLFYFSNPELQSDAEKTLTLLGFFAELFKGKAYLNKTLEALFEKRTEQERLTIIHVLHLANYMPQSLQNKFDNNELKYYEGLKGYGLPIVPETGIQNQVLLNLMWSKFFATGSYEYAKNIVLALQLEKYQGALLRFNQSEQNEKDKQEAYLETVYQKNKQDLLQRLPNHPLFNGYCLYMKKVADVPPIVIEQLEAVIVK